MPESLRAQLDRFAAKAGHRSVAQVLALARRDYIHAVGSEPRPRPRPRPSRGESARWWTNY